MSKSSAQKASPETDDLTIDESQLDMGVQQDQSSRLAELEAELAQLKAEKAASNQQGADAKAGRTVHRNMTEVVSLRNFRLASTSGHAVVFTAGVPKRIPNIILAEAMEKGCVPSDSLDTGVLERLHGARGRAKVEFKGDLRSSLLALFLGDFIDANNVKDFDAAGEVKHQVLSEAIGFDVTHEESQKAFRALRESQHLGEELPIHTDAPIVKQIIEASNKNDLLELLPHTKIKQDDVKGMQTRDLRKAMLASFAGYSHE